MKTRIQTSSEKSTSSTKRRVLGIDPGTAVTGYAVIDAEHQKLTAIDYGCIRIPATIPLPDRYLILFRSLGEIIDNFLPADISIETQYMQHNAQSALKVGMARGVAIVAGRNKDINVFEYAPTVAKRAVTGKGSASKHHVQRMVQMLLRLPAPPAPLDAADALALAICHAHQLPNFVRTS